MRWARPAASRTILRRLQDAIRAVESEIPDTQSAEPSSPHADDAAEGDDSRAAIARCTENRAGGSDPTATAARLATAVDGCAAAARR
jgi:hypothetical protein